MAVNSNRSMNAELDEGSTDGKYKKDTANRANVYGPDAALERLERTQLSARYYDVEEAPVMVRPDGKIARRSH